MRFGEGNFATQNVGSLCVAYLWRQSSVRGLFRISLANCVTKKGLAVPIYMDSQALRYPPPKSYALITHTLISGWTSACSRMGTR